MNSWRGSFSCETTLVDEGNQTHEAVLCTMRTWTCSARVSGPCKWSKCKCCDMHLLPECSHCRYFCILFLCKVFFVIFSDTGFTKVVYKQSFNIFLKACSGIVTSSAHWALGVWGGVRPRASVPLKSSGSHLSCGLRGLRTPKYSPKRAGSSLGRSVLVVRTDAAPYC